MPLLRISKKTKICPKVNAVFPYIVRKTIPDPSNHLWCVCMKPLLKHVFTHHRDSFHCFLTLSVIDAFVKRCFQCLSSSWVYENYQTMLTLLTADSSHHSDRSYHSAQVISKLLLFAWVRSLKLCCCVEANKNFIQLIFSDFLPNKRQNFVSPPRCVVMMLFR